MSKGRSKPRKEPRKPPKPRYLWLALLGVLSCSWLVGCNQADMKRLDVVDHQIAELTDQERALSQQIQVASLSAAERNAAATSLERTTAMLKELRAERELLAGKIQEESTNWIQVGITILFGLLGIGGVAGRKPVA